MYIVIIGILLPLLGTSIGSIIAIFFKNNMSKSVFSFLSGFACGVMIAASIWSLIIPGIELSNNSIIPVVIGLVLGMVLLLVLERVLKNKDTNMLNLAVTIHNIPEGLCVGCAFAAALTQNNELLYSAIILSLGISIQNIPEGSIVSLNLLSKVKKSRAILEGILSGVIEPIASFLAIWLSFIIEPILPYSMGFAAGAMIYVVINDLIPNYYGIHLNIGFGIGFVIMMVLDIILG